MENFKGFYILGEPIQTKIGNAHFVKVKEYPNLIKYKSYLDLNRDIILKTLATLDREVAKEVQHLSMLELTYLLKDAFDLYDNLKNVFMFIFKEDVFEKIETDEEFEEYRILIYEMNGIEVEKINPNPEIQRYNELKKMRDKRKSNGDLSFESIYTSVWGFIGTNPSDLTLYEFYALFNRICQFKNYDTTTLYNAQSGEVDVEPWFKHVNIIKGDSDKISLEEFSNKANSMMG